jgi:hypothetical protein
MRLTEMPVMDLPEILKTIALICVVLVLLAPLVGKGLMQR